MGFDQYHEPPEELPEETRTFARLCASLTEEAEAIGWYEQRIAIETDPEAAAVMRDAVGEEYKHFSMDLEFLMRRTPVWRETARGILFGAGDIVDAGEESEESADERSPVAPGTIVTGDYIGASSGSGGGSAGSPTANGGSLGIGGLREGPR